MTFRDQYAIAGLGLTDLGRLPGRDAQSIKAEAIRNAVRDAGLHPNDIDGLISQSDIGVTDSGGDLPRRLGLSPKFFWTLKAGGTTGMSSILAACGAIQAGIARHVVCFCGGDSLSSAEAVGSSNAGASTPGAYGFFGPLADHALMARRHMSQFGLTKEQLGAVPVTLRANANRRPEAQLYGRPLTLDDYLDEAPVVEPFSRSDSCLMSDGGAAIVVTSADRARDLPGPTVLISGIGLGHQVSNYYANTNYISYATATAKQDALRQADLELADIDFAQLYEPFSIGVVIQLEELGFCRQGEGGAFVADGHIALDGSIPVNTGGGQSAWAYLQGYTPLSEAVLQLTGRGGDTQLTKADIALVTGHGTTNESSAMYSDGCMILRRG